MQTAHRFHALAKPGGSTCNLDCDYCYYLSKGTLAGGPGAGRMSDAVLERFIQQYIAGVTGPEVVFSWQGGEPTLLGLDFFRRVVALQRNYARPGQAIVNDLQTNGTLLNEEWCAFLKTHKFLVGLSIDGPRHIHDKYRVTKGRRPTFDQVMRAVMLLRQAGVPFNTLTCVNRYNARRPIDVYRFLRNDVGSTHMQFIPIVEFQGFEQTAPPGPAAPVVTEWSVDPDDYGYFLCRIFDRWLSQDRGTIFVNHFETLVSQHLGLGSPMCTYHDFCGKNLAVEHDGSVYSCDHYVYPAYRLGSVQEGQLGALAFSAPQVAFGYAKSDTLPQYCRACQHLRDCWGECPKNRIARTPDGEPGLNYLCRGLKAFFTHAVPEVDRLAATLRQQSLHPRARTS